MDRKGGAFFRKKFLVLRVQLFFFLIDEEDIGGFAAEG